MKLLTSGLKWFTAVAVAVAGIGLGGGSLIAPDPAFAKYDASKLTIGGDVRVRGEFRRGATFGTTESDDFFVLNKMRLRVGYDVSPDVQFFTEIQQSTSWGLPGTASNLGANNNSVDGASLGTRQAYIGVKNAGVRNLNLKIGRQKLVFGNQRLLGHFDWDNVGFSHDAVRADYSTASSTHAFAWSRLNEGGSGKALDDSDLLLLYNTFKQVPNMTIEPYIYFLFDGRQSTGAATTKTGRVAPDQKRWFFGTRINGKAANKMIDYTGEFVWQTGNQKDGSNTAQRINAWAMAVKGGVTLKNMMWKPRFGVEVDYASGSGAGDTGGRHTFEGLFPTNHLHYGYMDRMGWKNMVDYSPQLLVRPDKASNLKINLHILRLASTKDNWYGANQKPQAISSATNQAASLGKEIDIIYTRKFKEGKFGLQVGYGHFFPGEYGARSAEGTGGSAGTGTVKGNTSQDWGYLQLVTKF